VGHGGSDGFLALTILLTMGDNNNFSVDNLAIDPAYNFLNNFLSNDVDSDSWSSPYDNLIVYTVMNCHIFRTSKIVMIFP
jgi:hypothetical protein